LPAKIADVAPHALANRSETSKYVW
jgi:hypothetical protein